MIRQSRDGLRYVDVALRGRTDASLQYREMPRGAIYARSVEHLSFCALRIDKWTITFPRSGAQEKN
jgi:hypothetical protein